MSSLADLNVRLGLIYKDFDKGLESVERKLRSSGRRLSDLGDQLTVSFSLPLAAAGAAAVKSAGDIESLTLALESQLGSTEEARKELELLRQEALKPGLGFEQAVRASVSLQAVGFEAEKARKITSEFGNALALAGKGAAELDGVVLALTQITAKGIVSAEEINQIAERLPQIRTLMQQAFGTASTEAIQKLGITSQQFIEGITAELQKLPRAAGGIKNALENFFDAIKVGAAKFGDAISKALDLPNTLGNLSAGLSALADGFANLNPEVQQYIVYAGLALVATGPLVKVYAALKTTGAQAIGMFQDLVGVSKSIASGALSAAAAFQKLSLAMKFTVAGAVLAGVTALYFAFQNLEFSVSKTRETLNEAAAAANNERAQSSYLIDVLKDENATRREKENALKRLKQISPEYFGQLKIEQGQVKGLTSAYDEYIKSIERAAIAKIGEEKFIALETKRLDALQRRNRLLAEGTATQKDFNQATAGFGSLTAYQMQAANTKKQLVDNANAEISAIEKEKSALRDLIKANTDFSGTATAAAESTKKFTGATIGQTESAKKLSDTYKEVLSDIANVSAQQDLLGSERVVEQAAAIEAGIKKLLDAGFKPASVQVQKLKEDLQGLFSGIKGPELPDSPTLPTLETPGEIKFGGTSSIDGVIAKLKELQPTVTDTTIAIEGMSQQFAGMLANAGLGLPIIEGIGAAFVAMAEAAGPAIETIASSLLGVEGAFRSSGAAALAAAGQFVKAALAAAIAESIKKSVFFAANPLLGIALGGIAVGALNALFAKAMQGLNKVPKFAAGTPFFKGGLAIVGDGGGPEMVNLPRGSSVTPNPALDRLLSNAGGDNFMVTHRIQGSDLLFIIERAQAQSKRVRGF